MQPFSLTRFQRYAVPAIQGTIAGLLTCLLLWVLSHAVAAQAYTREPSGDPATEPITFTVDSATDASSNCVGGYQTIAIQWQTGSPYSTFYFDWQADAAQLTWSEETCDAKAYDQGDTQPCTEDFEVAEVLVVCNDTADYDETWSAYSLDGTDFTWSFEQEATTTAATTTTDLSDTELGAYAILIFLLASVVTFVLIAP